MTKFLIFLLAISIIANLFQARWAILRSVFHVPVPDQGSFIGISTNPRFTQDHVDCLAIMGRKPICTAHSSSNPELQRFLYPNGLILNTDTNQAFVEQLGGASSVHAMVSANPKDEAEQLAGLLTKRGWNATVVEHYAADMKGKMYFVSLKDSAYNPRVIDAFRLDGSKLGSTKPWTN